MSLVSGTQLGPYEIVALIGAGGMGEVYKARDTRLNRPVAVKVLPQHLSDNPDIAQRFEREAKTIANVGTPVNLFTVPTGGIAVSPDGQRFLTSVPLEDTSAWPINILLNWAGEIRGQ